MTEVNVHDAKTRLSQLLVRVEAGEEIVIARAGKPVARLVPFDASSPRRPLGLDAGKIRIADDFDAPLPEDVLRDFEG
ncbi:MAG: type II toxin-antitoxin system Phd/YefM family antitoxin [Acidobacteria bacterium]|nr:MAG: type II toxin-antitoxin system Phd/YefM family antitoxin [Acidobacteriota bacterium]MCE7956626.1 type II toxin-antitoxin system Phd/YefM family antitoxin [Acidobacteria bacterium ACB2]